MGTASSVRLEARKHAEKGSTKDFKEPSDSIFIDENFLRHTISDPQSFAERCPELNGLYETSPNKKKTTVQRSSTLDDLIHKRKTQRKANWYNEMESAVNRVRKRRMSRSKSPNRMPRSDNVCTTNNTQLAKKDYTRSRIRNAVQQENLNREVVKQSAITTCNEKTPILRANCSRSPQQGSVEMVHVNNCAAICSQNLEVEETKGSLSYPSLIPKSSARKSTALYPDTLEHVPLLEIPASKQLATTLLTKPRQSGGKIRKRFRKDIRVDDPQVDTCRTSFHDAAEPDLALLAETITHYMVRHVVLADASNVSKFDVMEIKPSETYTRALLVPFFQSLQLEPQVCVVAMVYIDRILRSKEGPKVLTTVNWFTLLLTACLLASKTYDDMSCLNSDFAQAVLELNLQQINKYELFFAQSIGWNVHVTRKDYTMKFFALNEQL